MIKHIFLGIVQGLTEFFPVSSSGHLVVLQNLMGMRGEEMALIVVLHLGTCLSLLMFFFKDILEMLRNRKTMLFVIIVTVITGIIALAGKGFFEKLFISPKYVGISFLITGMVIISTRKFMGSKRTTVELKDGVILGLAQGAAIVPGLSRSGLTISTLLFRKIERVSAFRLSFLAGLPAVLGAAILESRKISSVLKTHGPELTAGFVSSFIFGVIALWLLRSILKGGKFYYFAYYCFIAGLLTLIFVK
ncbi:MAG: undecaprenyl-diphosphate phosphatase [Candidatus Omnitrophica bacterium]|nr:undecaprenyl-diphosphate phosphatase [Candidatus Omnitrophota bacterium]